MNYLSICSGIEAASMAWEPLGWNPVGFAEIEPFCRTLLKHYWPGVHNHGDFTRIPFPPAADLLVAGTPCQDFSVAGLRAGLDGARGNLTLEWLAFVERARFRWLVWENVPGVFSLDEGRVFGLILTRLAELGYGFAYRIFDAQFFGIPQRRRRVFIVGYLGDWRAAAAVLFERSSLRWNPAPSRPAREDPAGTLGGGSGVRGWCSDTDRMSFVADPVTANEGRTWSHEGNTFRMHNSVLSHAVRPRQESKCNDPDRIDFIPEIAMSISARDYKGAYPERSSSTVVAHTLRADGFDASEDGTGRGAPLVVAHALANLQRGVTEDGTGRGVPLVTHALTTETDHVTEDGTGRGSPIIPILEVGARRDRPDLGDGLGIGNAGDPMFTLQAGKQHAIAFKENRRAEVTQNETANLTCGGGKPGQGYPAVMTFTERTRSDGRNLEFLEDTAYALTNPGSGGRTHSRQVLHQARVRRLTPLECERLQGFPDNFTRIRYRGKTAADGPRYRALGNSMAVPVMAWIGERIQAVEELLIKLRRPNS